MELHRNDRQGYTLLELLIALAVLAGLAALSLPALRGPLDKSRLRGGARDVQTALARARSLAIREGRVIEFQYEVEGARYMITSVESAATDPDAAGLVVEDESTESGMATDSGLVERSAVNAVDNAEFDLESGSPTSAEVAGLAEGRRLMREGVLPVGVRFLADGPGLPADGRQLPDGNAGLPDAAIVGLGAGAGPAENRRAWSAPIVFLPSGRTQDAVIRIQGSRDFATDIRLRGLTGSAAASAPFRLPDISSSAAMADVSSGAGNTDPTAGKLPDSELSR